MGAIEKTVDAVARKVGNACQLVVVCGKNKRLMARLKARWGPVATLVFAYLISSDASLQKVLAVGQQPTACALQLTKPCPDLDTEPPHQQPQDSPDADLS